jgi:hypothetical protein
VNDNTKREQDYFFSYPYIKKDTISITLPQGFTVEDMPKAKKISNDFAKYESAYDWNQAAGKVTVYTSVEINQHLVKAKDYGQLMQFKKEVDADINQRLVVKKTE